MRMIDFSRSAIYSVSGWIQTVLYAAPRGLESVSTIYMDVGGEGNRQVLLEEYSKFVEKYQVISKEYQLPKEGVGSIYHRHYEVRFLSAKTPSTLIREVGANPDRFCDPRLAKFRKIKGKDGVLKEKDRFDISITGPWNGPVEVTEITDTTFTFVTLKNHMESGFITFSFEKGDNGETIFKIRSWASSGGPIVWLSYEVLGLSKKMQTKMWRFFCLKVAKDFGEISSELTVKTFKMYLS